MSDFMSGFVGGAMAWGIVVLHSALFSFLAFVALVVVLLLLLLSSSRLLLLLLLLQLFYVMPSIMMQFVIIVFVVMNISIRNKNTAIARATTITSVIFIISTIILIIIITVVFVISTAINAAARDQIMYSGDKALSPRSGKKLLQSLESQTAALRYLQGCQGALEFALDLGGGEEDSAMARLSAAVYFEHGDGDEDYLPNGNVATKVPPSYDGRSSWVAYEDAIDDWCDITELHGDKLLDRERLKDPNNGVKYFRSFLHPPFVKGAANVFQRMQEVWNDTYLPITDPNNAEVRAFVAGLPAEEQAALTDEEAMDRANERLRDQHARTIPITANLVALIFVSLSDLAQDEEHGAEGFLAADEDAFWVYDEENYTWFQRRFQGRKMKRGFKGRRKGKGKGRKGSGGRRFFKKRSHAAKGKGKKGKTGTGKGQYGKDGKDGKGGSKDGAANPADAAQGSTSTAAATTFFVDHSNFYNLSFMATENHEAFITQPLTPTSMMLDLGCTRAMTSRVAAQDMMKFCDQNKDCGIWYHTAGTQSQFTFANSESTKCKQQLVICMYDREFLVQSTEFDIVEQGHLPTLMSLPQMRNLRFQFDLQPDKAFLSSPILGTQKMELRRAIRQVQLKSSFLRYFSHYG
ncbi:hypothetical protein AK812_SmicGene38896 [Symbiodinium microadriaticum]|uniref:Uncharacterized protein n=1 Tax=Symbiodinium microadriaticum TaxID=2951 RepID=A0A1Q9CCL2_SYMMI|nr:hypothetical protein AK812_SmicGene38896 [Symbiodinium microadriaticum]